ncbi:N-(5'-phosphoribosyl)anthranilate isomerase [Tenacibaculum sp. SG-28]|nr:N-(5'-phosphoribosyl)anthranilate isomerase [Tenacibaculum sp. SG-28]
MKLKVCGMKYVKNIEQVAALLPDYLGFIFYESSKRNFEGIIPDIPKSIKKVGVFVNEYQEIVVSLAQEYQLEMLQLHGEETPAYIAELRVHLPMIKIIKVFSVKDTFNFNALENYENLVDYFLFDTKGKEKGGNGVVFNWEVLQNYPSKKPYFLSGGIGLDRLDALQVFLQSVAGKYCIAIDVNSKFETVPGSKETRALAKFKKSIENL